MEDFTGLDLQAIAQHSVGGRDYGEQLQKVLDALATCMNHGWIIAGHEVPTHPDGWLGADGVNRGVLFSACARGQEYALQKIKRLMEDAGPRGFPADFFFLRITEDGRRIWHERTGGKHQLRAPE